MSNQDVLLITEMGIRSLVASQSGGGPKFLSSHRFFVVGRQQDFAEPLQQKFDLEEP